MKRVFLITIFTALLTTISYAANQPKREFRGAWLHTVFQDQYKRQSTEANKKYISNQLDLLKTVD